MGKTNSTLGSIRSRLLRATSYVAIATIFSSETIAEDGDPDIQEKGFYDFTISSDAVPGDTDHILLKNNAEQEISASRLPHVFKIHVEDYVTVDVPLTSVHWGADPGVNYNNVNYGLGIVSCDHSMINMMVS